MKNMNPEYHELMMNADYAEASYNYFFLLGCNKKSKAQPFKMVMDKIEKELFENKFGRLKDKS
jgi:hypothetical protein